MTSLHLTGMQYCLAAIVAACLAGLAWMRFQERRDERETAALVDEDRARQLPKRVPGVAAERLAHLDAVWAQCIASRPYVDAMLAGFEAEVTGLLELALEVDDESPKPSAPDA